MTIRRTPADFSVTERLTPAFSATLRPQHDPRARHAIYLLEKTSLTTPEAISFLAKELRLSPSAIEYAGLKDKHALTRQHISIALTKPQRDAAPPTIATARAVTASLVGWSEFPITAAAIDVNHFAITIRDLTPQTSAIIDTRAAALTPSPGTLLFTNYYGDQRFGSARHEQGFAARHLITGDFDAALRLLIGTPARKDTGAKRAFTRLCANHWGDWKRLAADLPRCPERRAIEELADGKPPRDAFAALPNFIQQMCVDAWQSHLWNAIARERALELDPDALEADDAFGIMRFPRAAAIPESARHDNIPLPSPAAAPSPAITPAMLRALAAENVHPTDLRIPGLRRPAFAEAARPLFVAAHEFVVSPPIPDELGRPKRRKRTLAFTLPSGSYATVLLRALGH